MVNFYKAANKRVLSERSQLILDFPQSNGRALQTRIPMLENCQISERGQANLAEYDLLSRSNSLYAYLGAKSRVFNLSFNISLLHLLELDVTEGISESFKRGFNLYFTEKEQAKRAFLAVNTAFFQPGFGNIESFIPDTNIGAGVEHAKIHRSYYQKMAGVVTGLPTFFDGIADGLIEKVIGGTVDSSNSEFQNINKLLDMVMTWVNLIRATTHNNSGNTTLGPPIVRITHGPMYNNIPCVVDSYDIRILDESGYDVQTLMPKQIAITMTLKEHRTGNFGSFEATKLEDGDNHVGWEAVIGGNNMDPYNGPVGAAEGPIIGGSE